MEAGCLTALYKPKKVLEGQVTCLLRGSHCSVSFPFLFHLFFFLFCPSLHLLFQDKNLSAQMGIKLMNIAEASLEHRSSCLSRVLGLHTGATTPGLLSLKTELTCFFPSSLCQLCVTDFRLVLFCLGPFLPVLPLWWLLTSFGICTGVCLHVLPNNAFST